MPSWTTQSIEECCYVEYGTRVVRKEAAGTQYLVYGGGGETFRIDGKNRTDRVVISRFGMSPECVRFVAGDFFLNDSGLTLSPRTPRLSQAFLDMWTFAQMDTFYAMGRGSAQKNLDVDALRKLPLSFPNYKEQERIVAILEDALKAIDLAVISAKENARNSHNAFACYRDSFFDTSDKTHRLHLSDICEIKHGFTFQSEFFVSNAKHVLLTPGNFFERGGFRERGEKQKFYDGPIPEGFVLSKGDLLVAMTEQAAGLLASSLIIPESERFLHNQRLGLVVVKDRTQVDLRFLFHFFNSSSVRHHIHRTATGLKVRHTSPTKIGNLEITLPGISEQRRIADTLDGCSSQVKELEELYIQKAASLAALKQSLLHQAFSGNL